MTLKNKIQLITYPDSLGANLPELHYALRKYFLKAIGGVHLLPFYPSSSDRGFAPITYDEVDPAFGTWEDVEKIGQDFDLIIDFMVNHISRQSIFFQDYIEKGADSEYADMFLSFDKLAPNGEISDKDLSKVYTRKPRHPYQIIERRDGTREKIWCTFDYEQIDLDYDSPKTREIMRQFLIRLARNRPKMIRLDAVAYTTMEIGTRCFFLEPKIWELLDWFNDYASAFDTQILPEIHEHYSYQFKLNKKGYWCYDFSLPMLVLHALFTHTSRRLKSWLRKCPRKQITTLDTHDGIGVVDVDQLLNPEEIQQTIDELYQRGSNIKEMYSGPEYQNLDVYQVNCTYYSALGCNDDAYIAARVIQFFTPGIPQVYYVGLLAGKNDIELVEKTKLGRNINRHNYSLEEIKDDIQKPVVQRLLRLMEFRNTYPAFNGEFNLLKSRNNRLTAEWSNKKCRVTADIDLEQFTSKISYFDPVAGRQMSFTA
ncbi:MAG: sucrose phosphorylase [Proteobacteria bacterium]|nr:sucrose phosphorylase [Pseudomonadota bacterium]MBU1389009.1 sucrose phosphorylase [Pseudomonadota bacterium]MBU1543561.1 sucrose phosphorylase [Pseudomonadota bacterium]MBU2429851.1 sucrose phosphorylase [Pseudomonadota bacterium]MBU2482108.1 sucrose phosphorylase [Pseudomonadota bacterium]